MFNGSISELSTGCKRRSVRDWWIICASTSQEFHPSGQYPFRRRCRRSFGVFFPIPLLVPIEPRIILCATPYLPMSSLRLITTHDLAADPRRQHRINANSFQQDALLHYQGWQYTCFYSESDTTSNEESDGDPALVVNISRRSIGSIISGDTRWETLTLPDYSQVVDDGHNTISLGICHGDGTIHVSFDHHCNECVALICNSIIQLTSVLSTEDCVSVYHNQGWLTTRLHIRGSRLCSVRCIMFYRAQTSPMAYSPR